MPIVTTDVLIAGAGPAGLLLAAELAAAGLLVTVLADGSDQAAARSAADPAIVQARSLELLDAMGAADVLLRAGRPAGQVGLGQAVSIDLTRLPSRFPFALVTPRPELEWLLACHAASLGARVLGVGRIAALSQDADRTWLTAAAHGGAVRSFAAPYLVGADEAGGAVRAALGRPPAFVHGRVVLAGRAARPSGSSGQNQDVNAGLQDAANLGWKLAAILRGGADPGLVGTYQAERVQADRHQARIVRGLLMLPDGGQTGPVGRILTAAAAQVLRGGPAADLVARAVSGLSARYRIGGGSHHLAGRRAPDAVLSGRHARLYAALRERRPVLLVSTGLRTATEIPPLLALWPGRVTVAEASSPPALLTLVRPDGYIGWATDSGSPARRYAELRRALGEYCGPPAVRVPESVGG